MLRPLKLLILAPVLCAPAWASATNKSFLRACADRFAIVSGGPERSARLDHEARLGSFRALPPGPEKAIRAVADARAAGAALYWELQRSRMSEARVRINFWTRTRLFAYCAYLNEAYRDLLYADPRPVRTPADVDVDQLEDLIHGYCKLSQFGLHPAFAY